MEAGRTRIAAATAYVHTKRNHNRTDQQCEEAGIDYQPVVFESFGGIEKEGMDILNRLIIEWQKTRLRLIR